MIKLLFFMLIGAAAYAMWTQRQARARRVLAEIDEGRRCVSCDGTDVEVSRGVAKCLRCGHTVMLAAMRAATVTVEEIKEVTKPPEEKF